MIIQEVEDDTTAIVVKKTTIMSTTQLVNEVATLNELKAIKIKSE